ncbi:Anti-sigma-28 factor, FlgM [Brevinema andersonii]|uniref:Anti-sigma-28 factor, FlgM n=1 Tax=Brevinema andersonii TaxID=34097 RepID=A0A1I1DC27_BREAD|nr:flagellar biosynthesis anti-sigma factor FlgM [Brevinema andersonii]SFB71912.1 Anti-sigma-28 factor, FlgM [Brevinema andersonii]
MEIRGISGVTPPEKPNSLKTDQAPSSIKRSNNDDILKVSDEARFLEDEAFIREILAKTPDIDEVRIKEVKERLENGYYDKQETINTLTEKLLKALGL